jgi:hypothetical protein
MSGADDDNVGRPSDRPQRPHRGLPVTQVGTVLHHVVGRQVELDVHDAIVEPVPVNEADGAEDAEHRGVDGKGLGDEATEPGSP